MAWTLEIHHLDIAQGDATLIVANGIDNSNQPVTRSMLIDGGLYNKASVILSYLKKLGLQKLDVICVTHYDQDHLNGIRGLLDTGDPLLDATIIFDYGWGGDHAEQDVINYCVSMAAETCSKKKRAPSNRVRATKDVFDSGVNFDENRIMQRTKEKNWHVAAPTIGPKHGGSRTRSVQEIKKKDSSWLIGKEIFWWNANQSASDRSNYTNPPTITCVAANSNVLLSYDNNNKPKSLLAKNKQSNDQKNCRSLAFLIEFNDFKYYIGGDLESYQEDNMAYVHKKVHAMKASHHGSQHSSSQNFLNTLKPAVVFISCGEGNNFGGNGINLPKGHPNQRVLDDLENNTSVQKYFMTQDRSSTDAKQRADAISNNSESDFQMPSDYGASDGGSSKYPPPYTSKALVSGFGRKNKKISGDVILSITETQATQNSSKISFDVQYNGWVTRTIQLPNSSNTMKVLLQDKITASFTTSAT